VASAMIAMRIAKCRKPRDFPYLQSAAQDLSHRGAASGSTEKSS
jgi:hypothetical protein